MARPKTTPRRWYDHIVGWTDIDARTLESSSDVIVYDAVDRHHPEGDFRSLDQVTGFFDRLIAYLYRAKMLSTQGEALVNILSTEETQLTSDHLNAKGKKFMVTEYPRLLRDEVARAEEGSLESVKERNINIDKPVIRFVVVPHWYRRIGLELGWSPEYYIDHSGVREISQVDIDALYAAQNPDTLSKVSGLPIMWGEMLASDRAALRMNKLSPDVASASVHDILIGHAVPNMKRIGLRIMDDVYYKQTQYVLLEAYPCSDEASYDPHVLHHQIAQRYFNMYQDIGSLSMLGLLTPSCRSFPETAIV